MQGRWFITPHAVDSYLSIRRFNISRQEAIKDLIRYSETARLAKELDDSPCIFLYKQSIGKRRCRDGKRRNIYLRLLVSKRNIGMPQLIAVMTNGKTQQNICWTFTQKILRLPKFPLEIYQWVVLMIAVILYQTLNESHA